MDASIHPAGRVDRRTVLAGLASAGLVTTGGCVSRARSVINRDDPDRLSVTITTVSADADREAVRIARILRENLEAVGVDADIDMRSPEEFFLRAFVNHDADLYVFRHPGDLDPDYLYETLHSQYADESGYQNPYGYTNRRVDELLERQRRADGEDRREAVATLLEEVAAEQPFVPLCVPEETRLVRTDRFADWDDRNLAVRLGYLGLEPEGDADPTSLRAIITDARATGNLNPLSVEYRNRGLYVDLLYDSLATVDGGEYRPWAAEDWEWSEDDRVATVTLREDLAFHDGEPLTAEDVAFTYAFLEDTTLGEGAVRSPSPRYRGHAAAVDSIESLDERTLEVAATTGRAALERAFTAPILPEHVWANRTDEATVAGRAFSQATTDALVTDNLPPVGSGPFRYVDSAERDSLDLARFEEHFSLSAPDLPEPTVETLSTHVEPRSTAAIESIEDDGADVTVSTLESYALADVVETEDVRLHTAESHTHYQIGFDARRAPFANPYFRRLVARLLDEAWLAEEVLHGHGRPVATPVADEWVPESLEWGAENADPVVPFFGEDGDLDADRAREAFEGIGYRYDGEGSLLVRR